MSAFTIFPAIDLRAGQVVRLKYGDPQQQTIYQQQPAQAALRWLKLGAAWLHVVNLDGAFGSQDHANQKAIEAVLQQADSMKACVQLGGGIRTLQSAMEILNMGIARVILGTIAAENPTFIKELVKQVGAHRVVVGVDARNGQVRTRGWQKESGQEARAFASSLQKIGVETIIYTDIQRDGVGGGINLQSTLELAQSSGLNVIASGGIYNLADIQAVKDAGLPGVVVGRALYEGSVDAASAFNLQEENLKC